MLLFTNATTNMSMLLSTAVSSRVLDVVPLYDHVCETSYNNNSSVL